MSPAAAAPGLKLVLDKRSRSLQVHEGDVVGELYLTPTAYAILSALVEAGGAVVTHDELIARCGWDGWLHDEARAALRTNVLRLRRLLGQDVIKTVPWHGYAIDVASVERCPHCGRVA